MFKNKEISTVEKTNKVIEYLYLDKVEIGNKNNTWYKYRNKIKYRWAIEYYIYIII